VRLELDAVATFPRTCPTATMFSSTLAPKSLPLRVIVVPGSASVEERPLMDGSSGAATTVKESLVSEPPGVVTEMVPVVAPLGTVTWSCVSVADVTVAPAEPLKVTVFEAGVALKPVP
jgi:hypothetical protein